MLSPDSRTVAFDLLRPPAGYDLDFALVTTYTLNLEALLALAFEPCRPGGQRAGGLARRSPSPARSIAPGG